MRTCRVIRAREGGGDRPACASSERLITDALERIDVALAPDCLCGHCYEAELHRVRGELLLARDGLAAADEAHEYFARALAHARAKGAAHVGTACGDEHRAAGGTAGPCLCSRGGRGAR